MNKEVVDAAVEYWANFFTKPESKRDSFVSSFLSKDIEFPSKEKKSIPIEKIESFKSSLEKLILKEVSENETFKLATGWLPEVPLNELLLEHDLPVSYLPSKTTMYISKDKCNVYADGHEVRTLFQLV